MVEIIKFPEAKIEYKTLDNIRFHKPKNRAQLLSVCKNLLEGDDYNEFLCCILDEDYYTSAEKWIKDLVDLYYEFNF